MQDNFYWLWLILFMILVMQTDFSRRRLRAIEAKLDAALRRLGDNPTLVEAGLQQADQVADAKARALARRSVWLGLLLLVVGGAAGALGAWLWGFEGPVATWPVFGALIGYFLGIFLHGFLEGIRS